MKNRTTASRQEQWSPSGKVFLHRLHFLDGDLEQVNVDRWNAANGGRHANDGVTVVVVLGGKKKWRFAVEAVRLKGWNDRDPL